MITAEMLGDITSKDGIEETAYQMLSTSNQVYGMIRSIDDVNKRYDHVNDRPQYDKLATFVIEFVQRQMTETYVLQEIWIPENKLVEEKYHDKPKNNIFMSRDFYKPDLALNRTNRRALVLI